MKLKWKFLNPYFFDYWLWPVLQYSIRAKNLEQRTSSLKAWNIYYLDLYRERWTVRDVRKFWQVSGTLGLWAKHIFISASFDTYLGGLEYPENPEYSPFLLFYEVLETIFYI
jgi:hypothetical protein